MAQTEKLSFDELSPCVQSSILDVYSTELEKPAQEIVNYFRNHDLLFNSLGEIV